ncbi:MAG TPA: hypothetical protein VIK91_22885, partial [Nannocystis sp.]
MLFGACSALYNAAMRQRVACSFSRSGPGLAAAVLWTTACASSEAPPQAPAVQEAAAAGEPAPTSTPKAATVSGMIRPTKGGYMVGEAVVAGELLREALARAPGRDPKDPEWFLGAVVRIEGELRESEASSGRGPDGLAQQTREGSYTAIVRVDAATIEKPAVAIEGELGRSKGLFSLAGHLIAAQDLDWALAPEGGRPGDRVRLYGQPRTYVCAPYEQ